MTTLQTQPITSPPSSASFWAEAIASPKAWNDRLATVLAECAARGLSRIAIYGAGYHTRACAEALMQPPVQVLAIIDDNPTNQSKRLWGYPIVSKAEALALMPQAVVLSSNRFEEKMLESSIIFREHGIDVVRLYEPPSAAEREESFDFDSIRHSLSWEYDSMHRTMAWEYESMHRTRIADVRGWLTPDEELFLYSAARWGTAKLKMPILEIGAAWGRSTGVLALASSMSPQPLPVTSIDPHTGDATLFEGDQPSGEREPFSSLAEFRANMEKLGVSSIVKTIVKRSSEAVGDVGFRPFSLVWIDGSHEEKDVLFDLTAFGALVTPGGILAMHDYQHPPVRAAIDAWFDSSAWTPIQTTPSGNLAYTRRNAHAR